MKRLIFYLVILSAMANLFAQPKMIIDTGNVHLEYSLDNIQKITFKAMDRNTSMTVFPNSGFSQSNLCAAIDSMCYVPGYLWDYYLVLSKIDSIKFSQSPPIKWAKCYGGSVGEMATSIQQTSDKGYIISGRCESSDGDVTGNHGCIDYWVVKLDSFGTIEWQKSLGGSDYDWANSIQQTIDGGYIVAGSSASNDGDVIGNHGGTYYGDYWLVKLDSIGTIVWQKSLGGSGDEWANSMQQTRDGGYIVAGYSSSNDGDVTGNHGDYDYWIVKLNSVGTILWQKCYGGSNWDVANTIQQTSDGGYIVTGWSSSLDGDVTGNHGGAYYGDYWVVKLDSVGIIEWQKALGGSSDDFANSIQQTRDGGYIVAGYSSSNDGDVTGNHGGAYYGDYWLVKLDSIGTLVWQKCLGGTGDDAAYSIQQASDGGYIVAGWSSSLDGDVIGNHGGTYYGDYWLVKLDSIGTLVWQKCLGGTGDDAAYSIQQASGGGYIVAGFSNSIDGNVVGNHSSADFWIVKLNSKDTLSDTLVINYKTGQTEKIPICQIQKITFENVNAAQEQIEQANNLSIKGNYPNPFNEQTDIEFEIPCAGDVIVFIYDNNGNQIQKLECGNCQAGKNSILWDCLDKNNNHVQSGVYYYEVRFGNEIHARKMILVR